MPAMVTCAFNSSTQEGEAGRSMCVQGPCPSHSECQAQQGYIVRLSKQASKQTNPEAIWDLEETQWAKNLLPKQREQSSDPQDSCKCQQGMTG